MEDNQNIFYQIVNWSHTGLKNILDQLSLLKKEQIIKSIMNVNKS